MGVVQHSRHRAIAAAFTTTSPRTSLHLHTGTRMLSRISFCRFMRFICAPYRCSLFALQRVLLYHANVTGTVEDKHPSHAVSLLFFTSAWNCNQRYRYKRSIMAYIDASTRAAAVNRIDHLCCPRHAYAHATHTLALPPLCQQRDVFTRTARRHTHARYTYAF